MYYSGLPAMLNIDLNLNLRVEILIISTITFFTFLAYLFYINIGMLKRDEVTEGWGELHN
jgi:hypothetical protein